MLPHPLPAARRGLATVFAASFAACSASAGVELSLGVDAPEEPAYETVSLEKAKAPRAIFRDRRVTQTVAISFEDLRLGAFVVPVDAYKPGNRVDLRIFEVADTQETGRDRQPPAVGEDLVNISGIVLPEGEGGLLRFDLTGDDEVTLEAGKNYAFSLNNRSGNPADQPFHWLLQGSPVPGGDPFRDGRGHSNDFGHGNEVDFGLILEAATAEPEAPAEADAEEAEAEEAEADADAEAASDAS